MRAVVQRVSRASVVVEGRATGAIGRGLAVLAAIEQGDTANEREWMAEKLVNLRIFPDDEDRMNRSLLETSGSMLLVSNFTVAGDCRRGRRPSFVAAMQPPEAEHAFEELARAIEAKGVRVEKGVFGAHMDVEIFNDGPVTLVIDSPERSER